MNTFSKEWLIDALLKINQQGWIPNARPGNAGGVGNTIEDLLGIKENNLPIPNATEWELKAQRLDTTSLTTLFHMEPSPRALRFVPKVFLPKYGWQHEGAGTLYPLTEKSFRQTISGQGRSDRGFMVVVDHAAQKVMVSFDATAVGTVHATWLTEVAAVVGLGELKPQPYWGFRDLEHKAGTKLLNTFYVQAEVKREAGLEYFHYTKVQILRQFSFKGFLKAIEHGSVCVDFDARSGHNHGTKFRLRQNALPELYDNITTIL